MFGRFLGLIAFICLIQLPSTIGLTAHEKAVNKARPGLIKYPEFQHIDDSFYEDWLHGLIPPGQPHWVPGQTRPAGSLLLNMLIKDESEHLTRTLPLWAQVIDGWIIGVDDHNTDDSVAVIEKYLGHLPGHIVIVSFDGMGPTWSVLVKEGLHAYPQITHGIIADADFTPVTLNQRGDKQSLHLDRFELDVRCSKHMYTIVNSDHTSSRLMDWVYRNIAHVNVTRRTHQTLNAPPLPNQEVFQTLLTLTIEEHEGGYGDRSGQKDLRYIAMLEADLIDYPEDPRTLYYLAIAHLNLALQATAPRDSPHLQIAIDYFTRRSRSETGNAEERWFAVLKLAEIHERYLWDVDKSLAFYEQAISLDDERADGFFYAGQRLRLSGKPEKALPFLKTAASLAQPQRSLFQWHLLYVCLAKLEYAEAVVMIPDANQSLVKLAQRFVTESDCRQEPSKQQRRAELISLLKTKRTPSKKKRSDETHAPPASKPAQVETSDHERRVSLISRAIDWQNNFDALMADNSREQFDNSFWSEQQQHLQRLSAAVTESANSPITCRRYRRASSPFLQWIAENESVLFDALPSDDIADEQSRWNRLRADLKAECR